MNVPFKNIEKEWENMEVLDKKSFESCLNEILSSCSESETREEFEEKVKEIEEKYGKEHTRKVAGALLTVLKEKNNKKKQEEKV